jgi:hypothetical protein
VELIFIDVSELEPPEPMTKILLALSLLSPLQCLLVNHRREPFPLYSELNTNGWQYFCHQIAAEQFDIFIYRTGQEFLFERLKENMYGEQC